MTTALVVGAGFTGSSAARYLAERGIQVKVIDTRPATRLGGNAADDSEEFGELYSLYGPHLFHTNSDRVMDFLQPFAQWRPYEHRVKAFVSSKYPLVPLPIIFETVSTLLGVSVNSEAEMREALAGEVENIPEIATSQDVILAGLGRKLGDALFFDYTRKQWGIPASKLDSSVVKRVPIRYNTDDRYFTDKHQCLPVGGYSRMFTRMLDHPLIQFERTPFRYDMEARADFVIFTGCIDSYYSYAFERLGYRSMLFRTSGLDPEVQKLVVDAGVGTLNFPSKDFPFTRVTNFSFINGSESTSPLLCYEIPTSKGDPYYPIPTQENRIRYRAYAGLHDTYRRAGDTNVEFCGRLGSYQYLNMDQACAQGISVAKRILGEEVAAV